MRTLAELFKIVKQYHPCFGGDPGSAPYMCWAIDSAYHDELITEAEKTKLNVHINKLMVRKFGQYPLSSIASEYSKRLYRTNWHFLRSAEESGRVLGYVKQFWVSHFKEIERKR